MWRYHVEPTRLDRELASRLGRHASPGVEELAKFLTLVADERTLLGAAAIFWLLSQGMARRQRGRANYVALNVAVTALLPHLLKQVFSQIRPDRSMVHGRRRGIPRSGNARDAFPSGHAVHIGAVAAALARFFPRRRGLIWGIGGGFAATRVVLLAHWLSDVVAGLALGIASEALLWRLARGGNDRGSGTDVAR